MLRFLHRVFSGNIELGFVLILIGIIGWIFRNDIDNDLTRIPRSFQIALTLYFLSIFVLFVVGFLVDFEIHRWIVDFLSYYFIVGLGLFIVAGVLYALFHKEKSLDDSIEKMIDEALRRKSGLK